MNRTGKFACAVFFAAVAVAGSVSARGIGAGSGHVFPLNATNADACLDTSYGWVKNACGSTTNYNWETALVVDAPGSFNPKVFFTDVNSGTPADLSCASFAISSDGLTISSPGYINTPVWGAGSYNLGAVSVLTNGYLFVGCNLGSSDIVRTITW